MLERHNEKLWGRKPSAGLCRIDNGHRSIGPQPVLSMGLAMPPASRLMLQVRRFVEKLVLLRVFDFQ
jgi:hypothetical protein